MLVNDSLVCLEYPDDKFDIVVQVSPEVKAPIELEVENKLIVAGEVIPEQAPSVSLAAIEETESVITEKVKKNLHIAGELIPKKAIVKPKIR